MPMKFGKAQAVPEGSSRKYAAQLVDLDGDPIPSDQILTILLTLVDARTDAVINNRNRVSVLNTNGGSLSASGLFSMVFAPEDMVATDTKDYQPRKAIFEVTFIDGIENHEVDFWVYNITPVPA